MSHYNYYLSDIDYISPSSGESLDKSEKDSYDRMNNSSDENRSDVISDEYKTKYEIKHNLDTQNDYLQLSKNDLDIYNDENITIYSKNTPYDEFNHETELEILNTYKAFRNTNHVSDCVSKNPIKYSVEDLVYLKPDILKEATNTCFKKSSVSSDITKYYPDNGEFKYAGKLDQPRDKDSAVTAGILTGIGVATVLAVGLSAGAYAAVIPATSPTILATMPSQLGCNYCDTEYPKRAYGQNCAYASGCDANSGELGVVGYFTRKEGDEGYQGDKLECCLQNKDEPFSNSIHNGKTCPPGYRDYNSQQCKNELINYCSDFSGTDSYGTRIPNILHTDDNDNYICKNFCSEEIDGNNSNCDNIINNYCSTNYGLNDKDCDCYNENDNTRELLNMYNIDNVNPYCVNRGNDDICNDNSLITLSMKNTNCNSCTTLINLDNINNSTIDIVKDCNKKEEQKKKNIKMFKSLLGILLVIIALGIIGYFILKFI